MKKSALVFSLICLIGLSSCGHNRVDDDPIETPDNPDNPDKPDEPIEEPDKPIKYKVTLDKEVPGFNVVFSNDYPKENEKVLIYILNDVSTLKRIKEVRANDEVLIGKVTKDLTVYEFIMPKEKNVTVLESIDSNTVKELFESLDLANTAFLTVSKSGKTIECISQTLIIMKMVEDKLGRDAIGKHFFFLTENKESPITNLAKEFNIKTFEHHKTVGGRYSYLSNTGLIPACIGGLDIEAIRQGAIDTIEYVLNTPNNDILNTCASIVDFTNNGVDANVVMPYIDRFINLTKWYRQLWAESLGKGGRGTIPVDALGTSDQHSQLQLYMDGPRNKFYTFIYKDKDPNSLKITKSYNDGFKYLEDLTLDDIMNIEFESTVEVLVKRELPVRVIKFKEINEKAVSQCLMQFMLETIICGRAMGINPFGQHSVEERKILAREMMAKLQK